ncbi:MAG: nucleoside triphosphate pyrophosphohydrolase [Pseudomonadota bacterium]
MSKQSSSAAVTKLNSVMAALRHPVTGCPWDIEQTFASIAPYTIEEAYEVADAIERNDLPDLKEELGDLLLQVVYHARIAEEQNHFDFEDVAEAVTEKMINRHPHVFGTEAERAAGAAPGFWERIKAQEKRKKDEERRAAGGATDQAPANTSALDGVPPTMPALTRAKKLQSKAARIGFDWPSLDPVFEKLNEELAELKEAVSSGDQSAIDEEYGDLLFVIANIARHLDLDPEASLRKANAKFTSRFQRMETLLAEQRGGQETDKAALDVLNRLWDQAKQEERNQ